MGIGGDGKTTSFMEKRKQRREKRLRKIMNETLDCPDCREVEGMVAYCARHLEKLDRAQYVF